jgi:hypothetical protein
MKRIIYLFVFILIAIFIQSCKNDDSQGKNQKVAKELKQSLRAFDENENYWRILAEYNKTTRKYLTGKITKEKSIEQKTNLAKSNYDLKKISYEQYNKLLEKCE